MGEKRGEREAFERTIKRVIDQGKALGGEPKERDVRKFLQEKVAKVVDHDRERKGKR